MAVCDIHFRTPSRFERMRPALLMAGAFAVVVGIATLLRFWELGIRTFQGNETVSALLSDQIARGAGYEQIASQHGPLHFFITAGIFHVFGSSDTTARIAPALFGVLLAVLPFTFTRHIGRTGAVAAAVLLAVSPSMLYYSRFVGPDAALAFFSLATAMVIWRYLASPDRGFLYLLALTIAFMLISTEMALVVIAIFAAYLAFRTGRDLVAQHNAAPAHERAVTHYERLGVSPSATTRDIRAAYKAQIDRSASRKIDREAIINAYQVLTTASRREAYDRRLAQRAAAVAAPQQETQSRRMSSAIVMLAAAPIAALWPFMGGIRRKMNLTVRPAAADPMLVITMLALPFYGPLVEKLPFVGDRGFAGQTPIFSLGAGTLHQPGGELPVMLITLGVLFALAGIVGMAWKWHVWVICWAFCYGVVIAMFTGFFTDRGGVWTGIWGTLDYWWRPEATHVDGPSYYYAMIMPVYEIVPLAIALIAAAVMLARGSRHNRIVTLTTAKIIASATFAPGAITPIADHRTLIVLLAASAGVLALRIDHLTKFLAFWAVAAFCAFSAIGRKEPALAMHMALPLVLLSARLVNNAVAAFEMPAVRAPAMPSLRMAPARRLAQVLVLAGFVAGVAFTTRTGLLAAWGHGSLPQLDGALAASDHGDTPIELIQPDRIAPDVREVRTAIERAAAESGQGNQVPLAIDTSYDFANDWLWYLRDYPNITITDMRRGYQAPAGTIVLFDERNKDKVQVDATSAALTFTSSWSFPADYSRLGGREIAAEMAHADWWSTWGRYLLDRTVAGQPSAVHGVVYFPQQLSASLPVAHNTSSVLAATVTPLPMGPPLPKDFQPPAP